MLRYVHWSAGIAYPFPSKPPRMWRRTFERVAHKARAAEDEAMQAVVDAYGWREQLAPQADRHAVHAMVLEHLRRIAFLDIVELLDEDGRLKPIHDIPPDARSAIASWTVTDGGGITALHLHDRVRALTLLAKHLGLL